MFIVVFVCLHLPNDTIFTHLETYEPQNIFIFIELTLVYIFALGYDE